MSGFNLSDWALRNRSIVVYLMMIAVVIGLASYNTLGRNEDPSFVIKTMVVQAAWPGASVEDTLSQVTERLERTLQETPHLDFLRSYTSAGVTTIFVALQGKATPAEVNDTWYHVRKSVGDMRHTLPMGIVGPGFDDEFGDTFGIIYGFTADGFSSRELRDYVEDARSKLLHVADVSKIDIIGAQDEQIFIEFSMEQLANLGVDRTSLIAALRAQNVVRPSGIIRTGDENLALQVSGSFETEDDIRNVDFFVGDRLLRLSDIAVVRRGESDPPQPLFRVNGTAAIGLAIAMRDGGDILALGQNVTDAMVEITDELPVGIEAHLVADQAVTVELAIADFMTSLFQAIAIILVVSFIALGLRPGLVVALSIPLTLAVVFSVMDIAGIDMQRVSLGALIIALALLVDDAMTTTDAMLNRLAAGDDKHDAATFAFRTYAFAMLAGTLVTIAGFVPIGFAASSAGEYTYSLFAVVSISLVVSWFVAVVFAPLLGVFILKAPKQTGTTKPGRVIGAYRGFLSKAIRFKWATIAVTLAMFVGAVLLLPLVPRQFFPSSDRPELLVDLRLPQSASIHASETVARRFDDALRGDPDVERWSSYVGRGAIRFYLPLNAQLPNDFFAQAVVVAKDVAARERLQTRLEALLAEEFPSLVARVYPLELGPPVGWPVQYRVSGPDIETVRDISFDLAEIVAANSDTKMVNFDWIEPTREVRIRVDQNEARRLGLSSQAISSVLDTVITGMPLTQVRDDIYLVDVVARATDEQRVSLASLRTLALPLPGGRTVPLGQVASFEYEQSYPLVWRRDRVPTLTIQADVTPGVLPETVVSALTPQVEALAATLPRSYHIDLGGTVEESTRSQASVIAVVPVMLLIMLTVLIFQFESFQRLALVLSVAPLGLIGVVGALMLSGKPLGFVAILGILALMGMIIKNAVILIGQIDTERRSGKGVAEAVMDASSARFRPIMLTTVSTVLGMIPIAPTVFWGPMAFAIMGGLLVATLLTLIVLPTLYAIWFGWRERAH
ncbi:Multidrug efflux pump subunit AcrB [Aureimonas altamirensis DSM 21988]|uniref:AcrB/AcrD/AcrF family protein n=2 Tax=Aureimonas altamirensis TaxID=370622 RepID=A0A0N7KX22_9HYPH|nr:efflux RND transporter permease subunit [Aureimonas altamirensis]BAT25713.1 acrB/AcrD/AcrF family protein [Aureimonas altamirensis]SHI45324.1 Multidrug efflux pump subunit AcrB [Aureimonas altamirensis DSM 21988]